MVVVCSDDGRVGKFVVMVCSNHGVLLSLVVMVCSDDGGVAKFVVMVCGDHGV